MCPPQISNIINNLHSLLLPSKLWAAHVDPQEEFITILHVSVSCEKVVMDKVVLLTIEDFALKTTVSLNNEIVPLPSTMPKVETISDLTNLIYRVNDVKICMNVNFGTKCLKYVTDVNSNLCDFCSFEVFSETCREVNLQPTADLENVNLDNLEPNNQEDLFTQRQEKEKCLCTTCGKTFNTPSALEDHMLTHAPPKDKPFKCKVCMRSFAKKYNLNAHIRVHSGERPYVCSECGKNYSTRSNLSTHVKSAHCREKKYRCELCEMAFVYPRILRIHMMKHTGEKPFMCQICGKVFSKNIHLTIHTRTHTGEKPHMCSLCGKKFTTTGNLNMHTKTNHKD